MFDLDGPQLIAVARSIEDGRYLSGRTIEPPPHFLLGAVENPGAPPFDFASAGRRRRRLPAPASYSCRSATGPSCSSGSCSRRMKRG